jgi:hypothetical protein
MVDLAIGAAISGLKTAGEIAGSFIKMRDEAMIQAKVIELQSVILAAQSSALAAQGEQFALLEEKRRFEQKIVEFEDWAAEKQRYELKAIGSGAFAYAIKPGMENGEPSHWLCAVCFNKRHRSFLQSHGNVHPKTGRRTDTAQWTCSTCRAEITVSYTANPGRSAAVAEPATQERTAVAPVRTSRVVPGRL